jgi:hypothetical protein
MPAPQQRRSGVVVLVQEVLDGVPLASGLASAMAGGERVGPLGVPQGPLLPYVCRESGVQCALQPPSMTSELPVMLVPAGEQRKVTASATSPG